MTIRIESLWQMVSVRAFSLALPVALVVAGQLLAQEAPPSPTPETILIPQPDTLPLTEVAVDDSALMDEEDGETMLRGPVHEAYAEQVNENPVPGMIVQATPPEAVEELPPDIQPDGRTVEWISGYWAWDEDEDDFMWVSGIWREVPQGFRWLPGYWAEVEGGFQWVSGTWVPTQTAEIEYVETAPPETLEVGPVGIAPSPEHIWVAGCWSWQENRYAWRPGYYSTGYANWVWVPARHQWTPRGYYQCNGYWDYPLERRGVLFAPRRFNRLVRNQLGFRFTPRVVVASNHLKSHLWVRPRYRHYYFGDYYGAPLADRGLQPWHQFHRQHRSADPLFAHYSRGRDNNAFYNLQNTQFNLLISEPDRRPLHNLREQNQWSSRHHDHDVRERSLLGTQLQNFVEAASRRDDGLRFVKLENDQKQRLKQESEQIRELARDRRRVETILKRNDVSGRVIDKVADDLTVRLNRDDKQNDRDAGQGGRDGKGDEPKVDLKDIKDAARLANDRNERVDRLKLPAVVRQTAAKIEREERKEDRISNREEKADNARDAKLSNAAELPGKVMSEIEKVRRQNDKDDAKGLQPDRAIIREEKAREVAKDVARDKDQARDAGRPDSNVAERKGGEVRNSVEKAEKVEKIVRERIKPDNNDAQAARDRDRDKPERSNGPAAAEPADKRGRDVTPRNIVPDTGRVRDVAEKIRSDIQNRSRTERPAASEPARRESPPARRVESAPERREPPVRKAESAPERREPPARRTDPAPPRNDPPPRRTEAAPRKADSAPRTKDSSGGGRNEGGRRKK